MILYPFPAFLTFNIGVKDSVSTPLELHSLMGSISADWFTIIPDQMNLGMASIMFVLFCSSEVSSIHGASFLNHYGHSVSHHSVEVKLFLRVCLPRSHNRYESSAKVETSCPRRRSPTDDKVFRKTTMSKPPSQEPLDNA